MPTAQNFDRQRAPVGPRGAYPLGRCDVTSRANYSGSLKVDMVDWDRLRRSIGPSVRPAARPNWQGSVRDG